MAVSEAEEQKIFEENLKEAVAEAAKPDEDNGKKLGITGIIIGAIGLILPVPLAIAAGIATGTLGTMANKKGHRKLGMACGVLAIIDFLPIIFSI